jgi:hypothetical protein
MGGYLRHHNSEAPMLSRRLGIALVPVIALSTTVGLSRHPESPEVTVHEWGTFTSVAGVDGRAVNWLPLSGPSDLPCFVRHLNANVMTKVLPGAQAGAQLNFEALQSRMFAKVRMETPVIYFYSPSAFDAKVSVSFTRGLITEFYPAPKDSILPVFTNSLNDPSFSHSVEWNVRVDPDVKPFFPGGRTASHYYAARNTDATPLKTATAAEKFIFYRGVASFDVPIQTKVMPNGSVEIWNSLPEGDMPTAILFESRNGKMGFRMANGISRSVTLEAPTLDSDTAEIQATLRKKLVQAGLFAKEAQAMVDTWRDSWFEEGARVFYIMPQREADAILPLRIDPEPISISRVFVGRMELVNQATLSAVKNALTTNDDAALAPYARFLGPIAQQLVASGADAQLNQRINSAANTFLGTYLKQLRACE